jgi:hypothetical protein
MNGHLGSNTRIHKRINLKKVFGLIKNICTEHGYDLFRRNYFETSHAKGPQVSVMFFNIAKDTRLQ